MTKTAQKVQVETLDAIVKRLWDADYGPDFVYEDSGDWFRRLSTSVRGFRIADTDKVLVALRILGVSLDIDIVLDVFSIPGLYVEFETNSEEQAIDCFCLLDEMVSSVYQDLVDAGFHIHGDQSGLGDIPFYGLHNMSLSEIASEYALAFSIVLCPGVLHLSDEALKSLSSEDAGSALRYWQLKIRSQNHGGSVLHQDVQVFDLGDCL